MTDKGGSSGMGEKERSPWQCKHKGNVTPETCSDLTKKITCLARKKQGLLALSPLLSNCILTLQSDL